MIGSAPTPSTSATTPHPVLGRWSLVAAVSLAMACAPNADTAPETDLRVAEDVEARLARFAPTEMAADLSAVPASEQEVLRLLIEAGRLMDEVFLRQAGAGNVELRERARTLGDPVATYFDVSFGPWDRLDEMEPWMGDAPHPAGAGYYPVDMTKEEFEAAAEADPELGAALRSLHTVVRRGEDGSLQATPYSVEFAEFLEPAAARLREAAALTSNESLRLYLESRADAFESDDYFESDMAWMDLNSPVEVTIGPYEVYEDGLFAYKAAFEAFVTVDVPEQSARLTRFKSFLPALERGLPIPDEHKNLDRGTDSPIRVVDVVYVGGDSKSGVQTIAFNLPNDEKVREAKGSKKVILRNVLRAKYDQILVPIAQRTLAPSDAERVAFEAFLAEVLHHELSHGLGPGRIVLDGRDTEVRLELKELYSTLEEAKADVMGIYNILALIEQGEIDASLRATLEPTYVAGLFRSARFGVHEAHGQGVVSQFNFLLEKGALEVDPEGRFAAVSDRFPSAIEELLSVMLLLQAEGDYTGTAAFLGQYGQPSQALIDAIDRLEDVPVDIRPIYSQADEITG